MHTEDQTPSESDMDTIRITTNEGTDTESAVQVSPDKKRIVIDLKEIISHEDGVLIWGRQSNGRVYVHILWK